MGGEHYEHLSISGIEETQGFTSTQQGREKLRVPERDPQKHGAFLRKRLAQAWQEIDAGRAVVHTERHGAYIEFEGALGSDLKTQSLEYMPSGIRLCSVRQEVVGEAKRTFATVYVPNDKRRHFLKVIDAWDSPAEGKKARNGPLLQGIEDIRRAVLESFWRFEERSQIPGQDPDWVEVWLNTENTEEIAQFKELLHAMKVGSADGELIFPERSVLLIKASREQLSRLIESSDKITEYRAAVQVATEITEMENRDQAKLVEELVRRARFDESDVVVCILDGGVNNGHRLLQPLLDANDMHAVLSHWGVYDHDGHGTLMAGTASYGDLLGILNNPPSPIRVTHRLESSKILPPPPARNPKDLWGHRTSQGVSLAEIQAPDRKRILCMGVASIEDRDQGRPSSWSAAVDAIASGYEDETKRKRLFIISAGNVDDSNCWRNYHADNITNEVHNPGQAWNALTVGACTQKVQISDPTLASYSAIAPAGGLSPYSTTSTSWHQNRWAVKPDVLMEGGNVARGPNDSIFDTDDLKLISTWHKDTEAQFAPFCATSASAAQAAWMAAKIQVAYPDAWPETVRGLIVHSAGWTDTMLRQFLQAGAAPTTQQKINLLRICGYGVPNLSGALYSLANSLTLIAQAELQPFDKRIKIRDGKRETSYGTKDMHLYRLPWPTEELKALQEKEVTMRVTLSYFVEPGPWEVGWSNRYRYASHALRFSLNGPQESPDEFVQRVNKQAREEGEGHPGTAGPGDKWFFGKARDMGSIHSDIWRGTAEELASSNVIAVYPTTGWWRERSHLKRWDSRCRYSLIVSIHTAEQDVDIYTPVAIQLGIATPIVIGIGDREA